MLELKPDAKLIPHDPSENLLDKDFIGKAIVECLSNNDLDGATEIIYIYLYSLSKKLSEDQNLKLKSF